MTIVLVSDLAQLHFRVPQQAAEAVVNLLHELAGGGVEERDADTLERSEPGMVEFVAWVSQKDIDGHVQAVERLLGSLKTMGVETAPFSWTKQDADPNAWVDAYKSHFKTTRLARRFVVKPSWDTYRSQPGDILIELDPGMAFGTGLHASTKLVLSCLDRIARLCPTPNTILDLGTGTGILAIAAAKLWSTSKIVAVDNDPTAVEVCRENIERNGLKGRIDVQVGSAGQLGGRYTLVLANLSYEVLSHVAGQLIHSLDDFGRIVLSGLLADQAQSLCIDLSRQLVLEPEYSEDDDGWRALLLRVRA